MKFDDEVKLLAGDEMWCFKSTPAMLLKVNAKFHLAHIKHISVKNFFIVCNSKQFH